MANPKTHLPKIIVRKANEQTMKLKRTLPALLLIVILSACGQEIAPANPTPVVAEAADPVSYTHLHRLHLLARRRK